MGLFAKETGGGSSIPLIPNGVYQAVCIGVYDLGTQYSQKYDKSQRKVRISWEIQEERIELDGESLPRIVSKEYTLSLNEKATLRAALEAWRGKPFTESELDGFDLARLLGANCYLNMVKKPSADGKKFFAVISSITPLRKSDKPIEPEGETAFFSFDDEELPSESVPEWIRKKMAESEEYKRLASADQQTRKYGEAYTPPRSAPGGRLPFEDQPEASDDVPF